MPRISLPQNAGGKLDLSGGVTWAVGPAPPLAGGGMDGQGFDPLRVLDSSPYLGGGGQVGPDLG